MPIESAEVSAPVPVSQVPNLPYDVWMLILPEFSASHLLRVIGSISKSFNMGVGCDALWRKKFSDDFPEEYSQMTPEELYSYGWAERYKAHYRLYYSSLVLTLTPFNEKKGVCGATLTIKNTHHSPLYLQPLGLKLLVALYGGIKTPDPMHIDLDQTFATGLKLEPQQLIEKKYYVTLKFGITCFNLQLRTPDSPRPLIYIMDGPQCGMATSYRYKFAVTYARDPITPVEPTRTPLPDLSGAFKGSVTSNPLLYYAEGKVCPAAASVPPPVYIKNQGLDAQGQSRVYVVAAN